MLTVPESVVNDCGSGNFTTSGSKQQAMQATGKGSVQAALPACAAR